MKGKFKVGDIVEYRERFYFSDDIKIIGYIIDASITDADIPLKYYEIVILKKNKKCPLRNGKIKYVSDCNRNIIKKYKNIII